MNEDSIPTTLQEKKDQLLRDLPLMILQAEIVSRIQRAKYLSLIEEGFNENQALVLCQNVFGVGK